MLARVLEKEVYSTQSATFFHFASQIKHTAFSGNAREQNW